MSREDEYPGIAYSEIAASERNSLLLLDIRHLQQERDSLEMRLSEAEGALDEALNGQDHALSSLREDRDALLRSLGVMRNRLEISHKSFAEAYASAGSRPAVSWRMPETADVSGLRVAAIMDEFTTQAFTKACHLFPLSVANWEADIENSRPDLLLIESAWEGNGGAWRGKVNHLSPELIDLVAWCKARSIPTAFWNKEDPGPLRLVREYCFHL